ncbi:hypothetical protein FPV67DRAFT_1491045 [Lyophyllum atratum]|nr:hypothetical protein FPV67DRAFT_1491045 [Lyophyllum atratum]
MCHWSQVYHKFALCAHVYSEPSKMILCHDRWCTSSPTHHPDCPYCEYTCCKRPQSPQNYSWTFQRLCDN